MDGNHLQVSVSAGSGSAIQNNALAFPDETRDRSHQMTANKRVAKDPAPRTPTAAPTEVDWTVTVIEPLANCPSVEVAWETIATQTKWGDWRSESKMRGEGVVTTLVPPSTEPLTTGEEYVVSVGRFMKIRCRVLEAGPSTTGGEGMVFDSLGVALGGMVKARFRFTLFRGDDGIVMAKAQEKIRSLPLLTPSVETLESEHRHTFTELNKHFSSTSAAP